MLTHINPENVPVIWDTIKSLIQRGFEKVKYNDRLTLDFIYDGLINQTLQLWLINGTVIITQIEVYPTGVKEFNVLLMSGKDVDPWLKDCIDRLMELGESRYCKYLTFSGRKGWSKVVGKLYGDKLKTEYRYSMELQHGR